VALWGGRFSQGTAAAATALSRSVQFDWRLAPYDLRSSLAHLAGLEKGEIISKEDSAKINKALKELANEVNSGKFLPNGSDEDVHSALERGLVEKLGDLGGKLRAGRSRNDQVATDLRLYAIDHILEISKAIIELQKALLAKSKEYADAPAPGFTHLQHAQPILFGHELAKHIHAFERDLGRINDWLIRSAISPLGAGALSGSALPLDPVFTANNLGFAAPFGNSIDAVSDRDFVAEALFMMAMVGIHLSRIGEEWTIWSTTEFGWAKLADEYSTGSSIMPQKKNPDLAELARGKTGRLIGNLTSVMAMLKGLPFAYNRDLQEDKEPLFDSIDTLMVVLPALTGMVASTNFDRVKMTASAGTGFALATEIADYLVKKGMPFSKAHEISGKCVALAEGKGVELDQLSDSEFTSIEPLLDSGIRSVLTVSGALSGRITFGGTAPKALEAQLKNLEETLAITEIVIDKHRKKFSEMMSQ
jgi:argininosuccinate lyase